MYVVCFGDGLGNQMFQYAFYKSLINNYPDNCIKADIFFIYGKRIHNGFELKNIFGIDLDVCDNGEALILAENCPKYMKYWIYKLLHKVRRKIHGYKDSYISQDDPTGYYEDVYHLSTVKSYIFRGNWVNEKYFKNIRAELLKDFCFPCFDEEWNIVYSDEMKKCNSVSVHIRKGDYINSDMINLDKDYYKRAKYFIENSVENPKYYIFTDDKNAIAEYLDLFDDYTIVKGNCGNKSYRDMQLMALCKHNIIANSTFSFWGAYLNINESKIVIAPSKAKFDFRHPFACEGWTIIEVG